MPETPPSGDDSTTRAGDYVQQKYHVTAAEAGDFLIAVGESLQSGDDVTLSGDDWDLTFAYRDSVELEIEHVGGPDAELEIELELSAASDADTPPSIG